MIVCLIRAKIEVWDEYIASQEALSKEMKRKPVTQFDHVYLRLCRFPTTISDLTLSKTVDVASDNICRR